MKNEKAKNPFYSTVENTMSVGVSTVIGTLGFSDMYSTNKHHATSVEIPNGIYVGGDVAIGGGEVIGIDSWVAGGVSRKKTANS